MIMRLVKWIEDSNKLAVLFLDGSMQKFEIAGDPTLDKALTDFLTRFRAPQDLTAEGNEKWSDSPDSDDMATWGKDEVETAAYVVQNNVYHNQNDFMMIVVDPSPIVYWMQHTTISISDIPDSIQGSEIDKSNYRTLIEYCQDLEEEAKANGETSAVTLAAIRTKVARHQLPGAVKIGSAWYVYKGTPWPSDRRYKSGSKK